MTRPAKSKPGIVSAFVLTTLLGAAPTSSAAAQDGVRTDEPGEPMVVTQGGQVGGGLDLGERAVVLPFDNITGHTADQWIGVGIAESVATDLRRYGVSVIGRTHASEVFEALKAGDRPGVEVNVAIEVGRRLGADWVVVGGYQRVGDQIRITAFLSRVETATVVQTVKLDGAVGELFALQDRLVHALTGQAPAPSNVAHPADVNLLSDRPAGAEASTRAGFSLPQSGVRIEGPPPPEAPATISRNARGAATVRATRLSGPWILDGTLDEPVYEQVAPIGGFIQQEPHEGEPATEQTDAWVLFDAEHVYVAARLWDSAPEDQWLANVMRRDSRLIRNNDTFGVVLDTYYDRRNAVGFMVNPIGGVFDFEISDEVNFNIDWNPVWDVRTGRFDGGWTIEMQIPFKSLRYRQGASQVWGIQLERRVRRKNERSHLNPVPISAQPGISRVSAAGTLVGLEAPMGGTRFEVKPYGIGSTATDLTADPPSSNDGDGDWGVDAKWGVTQNLTADFTYNTDFAQVEVDEQQVNLTRFSLFFPEKREFFLEGRGIFDFGSGPRELGRSPGGGGGRNRGPPGSGGGSSNVPTIFFSRRIGLEEGETVPILGGGRLTGKVGQLSVGALNIQTDDEPTVGALATNFTVIRLKQDILRRSRIGGIYTRRSVSRKGDGSNEAYGLDGAFSFYDNVNFNGYYARTRTQGLTGDDTSYQAAFTYDGDLYGVQVDHLLVGEHFNPEVGFLRRDDFRRTFAAAQYSPRPQSIQAVRQFTWGGSLDYIENGAGQVETRLAQVRFNTELENSDQLSVDVQQSYELLAEPFDITSDVTIPVGGYSFQDLFLSYQMGGQPRVSGTAFVQRGGFFSGDITAFGYRQGQIEITPQLSVEPSVSINKVDLPEGGFTATLATGRVTYSFTPRMFFSGLVQYNSTADQLGTNLRFRWEYQPGSELFVVYNDQRDTALRGRPMLENRAFVVKITRLFRF